MLFTNFSTTKYNSYVVWISFACMLHGVFYLSNATTKPEEAKGVLFWVPIFLVLFATFYFSKKAWLDSYNDITTRSRDLSVYKKIFYELNEPCIILQAESIKPGKAQSMKAQHINNAFAVEFEENISQFQ